jgi:hypothetical protein
LGFGDLRPRAPGGPPDRPDQGAGTVKDLRVSADSETVKAMNMTTKPADNITDIEDAAAAKWLAKLLEPARARAKAAPDAEAVGRIRARVFGDALPRKASRRIAA